MQISETIFEQLEEVSAEYMQKAQSANEGDKELLEGISEGIRLSIEELAITAE